MNKPASETVVVKNYYIYRPNSTKPYEKRT
ncbi:MAG: hypothetical protein RLZZ28_2678 [Bacteroidota bacterium]